MPRVFDKQRTRQVLAGAADHPSFLPTEKLGPLQNLYPFPPEYGYDPQSLEIRGKRRTRHLLSLPGFGKANDVLEIGCLDGMVSCMLARLGKRVTAIDVRDAEIDKRAIASGVDFRKMDATAMQFADDSFDAVFSYDTFEHVVRPDDMLKECVRVVRKGGLIYLNFGPLYMSPFGEHAYRSITIPYCQHLFPLPELNAYALGHGLSPIEPHHVNRWRVRQYRELWRTHRVSLDILHYRETLDLAHLGLIRQFPSCFKSKSVSLDEFVVSGMRVVFQRTA